MKSLFVLVLGFMLSMSNYCTGCAHDCNRIAPNSVGIDPIRMLIRKINYTQEKIDELSFEDNRDALLHFYMGKKSAYEDCIDLLTHEGIK